MASLTRTVLGTCHHDCPDSCGWVVTVEDGVATKLRGNPAHPFSRGELCPKVNRILDRVYSPDRILTPLIRSGAKGTGEFRPATWAEALSYVSEQLHHIIDTWGAFKYQCEWPRPECCYQLLSYRRDIDCPMRQVSIARHMDD